MLPTPRPHAVLGAVAALLAPVLLSAPGVADGTAGRYNADSRAAWRSMTPDGLPAALAQQGWGTRPVAVGAAQFGSNRWTYPRFPLPCNPSTSPLPSYEVLWVQADDRRRPTVMDTQPGLVRRTLRRVASVFAASTGRPLRTQQDLATSLAPRFLTTTDRDGRCQPRVDRVTVPLEVLRREAVQNWVNPATGAVEQGLFAFLETHGWPARDNRRTIAIVADLRAADYAWWGVAGESQGLGIGNGYGPVDDSPGPQNRNNGGGVWAAVFTSGRAWDFQPEGSDLTAVLAHELAHGLGAVLPTSAHYNALNPGHPGDCADVLCYNSIDQGGQDYQACSSALRPTFDDFIAHDGPTGRASLRLDCHRDDYFAVRPDGGGELPWADERWSISRNRFLWGNQDREPYVGPTLTNPPVPPSCLDSADGYCPPGIQRPAQLPQTRARQRPDYAIS